MINDHSNRFETVEECLSNRCWKNERNIVHTPYRSNDYTVVHSREHCLKDPEKSGEIPKIAKNSVHKISASCNVTH